jgi:hypothetical protein
MIGKSSEGDYAERPFWDAYTNAFVDALGNCSTEHAPWFIIPSNHKWFLSLVISRIVAETLESLDMKFPKPTVNIDKIKENYHAIVEEEKASREVPQGEFLNARGLLPTVCIEGRRRRLIGSSYLSAHQ